MVTFPTVPSCINCRRNLSPMILISNQMVYLWNQGINLCAFCSNIGIWAKRSCMKLMCNFARAIWSRIRITVFYVFDYMSKSLITWIVHTNSACAQLQLCRYRFLIRVFPCLILSSVLKLKKNKLCRVSEVSLRIVTHCKVTLLDQSLSWICLLYVLAMQKTLTTYLADFIVDSICSFGSNALFAFASSPIASAP